MPNSIRQQGVTAALYIGAKQEIPYGMGSFHLFAMDCFRKPNELDHPGN
jgi:hypothetical protein